MIIKKAFNRLRGVVWDHYHKKLCARYRKNFHNPGVSVISMNCNGGILLHDLGMEFCTPTVNLFIRAEDFIKFCENLDHYLAIDEMVECRDPAVIEDRTYPIAYLGDITLFLVHYKSVAEAQQKWNERKMRICRDNIVIMNTDREGMTDALKDHFEKLPYRKVMFVHRPDENHSSCFYIRGYEKEECVGIVTEHTGWRGLRPIDQFDWVSFLNGAKNNA